MIRRWRENGLLLIVFLAISTLQPGCSSNDGSSSGNPIIDHHGNPPDSSSPTFYRDVLPLVQTHCAGCHYQGGIGGSDLSDYDTAFGLRDAIVSKTAAGEMPPWPPDPNCQAFVGARFISSAEKSLLKKWRDTGAYSGMSSDAPSPMPTPAPTPAPSVVMHPDAPFSYSGSSADHDLYECFWMDPNIADSDTKIFTKASIEPGNQKIVHHVIMYRETTCSQPIGTQARCSSMPPSAEFMFAWVPGTQPTQFPDGVGMQLGGKDCLIMQVHYNNHNGGGTDLTKANIWYDTTGSVSDIAHVVWTGTTAINLPPHSTNDSATGTCSISADSRVIGTAPHMHTLGTTFVTNLHHSGATSCMIHIPHWDFSWQGAYIYKSPISLTAGDTLTTTCTWDNPKSTPVTFGEGTDNEMCFNFLYVVGPLSTYCF